MQMDSNPGGLLRMVAGLHADRFVGSDLSATKINAVEVC